MAGDGYFGDGGHANGIGANHAQETQIGGGFKRGAAKADIDTRVDLDICFSRNFLGQG